MVNDMKKLLAALPVFAAALVLAGSASHAFTFENNSASSSNGSGPRAEAHKPAAQFS